MPELPEVESVRRQLEPELSGRRVLAVWADTQRRFPTTCLGRRTDREASLKHLPYSSRSRCAAPVPPAR